MLPGETTPYQNNNKSFVVFNKIILSTKCSLEPTADFNHDEITLWRRRLERKTLSPFGSRFGVLDISPLVLNHI